MDNMNNQNQAADQANAQVNNPAGVGSTPTASSPIASTPLHKFAEGKGPKNIKSIIIVIIVIIACISVGAVFTGISKNSAQKRLDKTVEICEDEGLFSDACKKAQEDNDVECSITGCEASYHRFIIF